MFYTSEIRGISISMGLDTTLVCMTTDIQETPQVLVSTDSSSLYVVNSKSAYAFSITDVRTVCKQIGTY